ncbi:MAG TPA: hypothetical protein VMA97_03210 [Streptosporangiaceae bacterium]|nr:hypothetical protein [Streptosporangiaceae bacterium]
MVAEALLASWRDTPTRQAVIDFVRPAVADGGGVVSVKDDWATSSPSALMS